jgi:hypothetical protein
MKYGIFFIILGITFWPMYPTLDPYQLAQAETSTNSSTSTGTNCSTSGKVYGGGSMNHCNTSDNQQNTQDDTKKLNDQGSNSAASAGMAAIAAGMAMIAAGVAMMSNPPTAAAGAALVAAGTALLMAGMQAMAAAQKMANNAGISGYRGTNMSTLNTATLSGTDVGNGSGASGIKIDPSLLRNGKIGSIMDDFEKKTGISRDDLKDQLEAGKSPAEIMAQSNKFGGASEAQLQGMLDKNSGGTPLSNQEMMDKLGLTPEDLMGENVYAQSGSGGPRSPASNSGSNGLDGLLGKPGDAGSAVIGSSLDVKGLSPEIQSALDKSGITNRTLFQMVHSQYKKKTPMMFGQPSTANPITTNDNNPFANLGGAKVEL